MASPDGCIKETPLNRLAISRRKICILRQSVTQRLQNQRNLLSTGKFSADRSGAIIQMTALARLKIVILGWASASLFFTAVLEISELGHKPLGFALYSNAVHFALWTLTLPILARCIRRFPLKVPKRIRNAGMLLILIAVLALLVDFTHWAIVLSTYFPDHSSHPTFQIMAGSDLFWFLPNEILIGIVLVTAIEGWQVLKDLQAERMRAVALERQLAVSRLEALRMQLHPHFLFNTLHNIAGLTVEDPATARRMVIALGDLLRSTLKDNGNRIRTLAEELEYSDLYLGIEKLRLGYRLLLNYEIEPAATRAMVPQFLLQPLFENAIRHGASQITGRCEICFCASRKSETLNIMIRNDGPKCATSFAPPRFGVGLTNTIDRLQIHYGNRHTFLYSDRPEGGVQIDISIPYSEAGDGAGAAGSIEDPPSEKDRMDRNSPAVPTVGYS
jgi:two-component system, LytTR family, sensor kinase